MTNHEKIKSAFGDIKAPESLADKIINAENEGAQKPQIKSCLI